MAGVEPGVGSNVVPVDLSGKAVAAVFSAAVPNEASDVPFGFDFRLRLGLLRVLERLEWPPLEGLIDFIGYPKLACEMKVSQSGWLWPAMLSKTEKYNVRSATGQVALHLEGAAAGTFVGYFFLPNRKKKLVVGIQ